MDIREKIAYNVKRRKCDRNTTCIAISRGCIVLFQSYRWSVGTITLTRLLTSSRLPELSEERAGHFLGLVFFKEFFVLTAG